MNTPPEYHYAAFKSSCGCLVGLCVDLGDKETAKVIGEWIKEGCYIERHHRSQLQELLDRKGFGCDCEPAQPGLFDQGGEK